MKRFVGRPSPSMLVACVALLVALGGTSVAAVRALPRASVNTAAIQNGAVTTGKLANRAVTLAKLSPRARLRGPKGNPGPKGETGNPGPKGDKGDKGDPGPSEAYADTNAGPVALPAGANVRVATLSIPAAGMYVIWAKANLHADPGHTNLTSSACRLGPGAATDPPTTDISWSFVAPGALQVVANSLTLQLAGAAAVNFYCVVSGVSDVRDVKLVAIKVGALTTSTG